MDGTKAHYDGIVAFSQTDFTEDLKKITVPVLVMHGDDDQMERDARLSRISRLGHDGPPGGVVATSRPPGLTQPRRAGVLLLSRPVGEIGSGFSCHRPNVELAVIEQREFELSADSADIALRKE